MDEGRRRFLKTVAGAGAASISLAGSEAAGAGVTSLPGYPNQSGVLVDTTLCIGCRRCEWACKEWNKLPNQKPLKEYEDDRSVFKEARRMHADSYTVVNRFLNPRDPARPIYVKRQCMHCLEPACASSCFVRAFTKRPIGAVTYDAGVCVGCRYCMAACPFYVPAYQYYEAFVPQVTKCTFCFDRISKEGWAPACVAICPVEVMTFGKREDLIELAHKKIRDNPGRYYPHLYGEHEVGGTCWMYLSGVPFEQIGFRTDLGTEPIPGLSKMFLTVASPMYIVFPALALGIYSFSKRRDAIAKEDLDRARQEKEGK